MLLYKDATLPALASNPGPIRLNFQQPQRDFTRTVYNGLAEEYERRTT